MKEHLLNITILLLSVFGFSQNNQTTTFKPKINNIPSSPEAGLLGKFGDIPIGLYTGTANITIPIYTIEESGVEIPIQLRYHSSGVKVAEDATWVGLGWDLSPGGAIIQEIRGKEDYLDNNLHQLTYNQDYLDFKSRLGPIESGLYYSMPQTGHAQKENNCNVGEGNFNCNGIPCDAYQIIEDLLQGEGQPDIYHYSFGNYSGKFYINPESQEIVLMDNKDNIKFQKIGLYNEGWLAMTSDGNKYFFEAVETSTGTILTEYKGKTVKLTRIEFYNGRIIQFNYINEFFTGYFANESATIGTNVNPYENPNLSNEEMTLNNKKTLASITTSEEIIEFVLENRDDINKQSTDNVKRLKRIDVKSSYTNKKIKSFEFVYSYFPCNYVGAPVNNSGIIITVPYQDALCKRLKLDQIKEIGFDSNEIADLSTPPHQFEYNTDITLPVKNSKAVDFFGYYNGKNNLGLLPDLDYFDYPYLFQSEMQPYQPFSYIHQKNDRFSDANYSGGYMLKKVIYPTGGRSEFEYESNSFNNQFIPNKNQINLAYKVKVAEDNNLVGNIVTQSFQLSKSTTIRFENTINNGYTPNNGSFVPYTLQQMMGSLVKLYKVNTNNGSPIVTTLKQWDLTTVLSADFDANNGKQWIEDYRIEYDPNPNVTYYVTTSLPNNLANNTFGSVSVKSRFYYYDDTGVNTSSSFGGGMRIKSIKNYTRDQVLSSNKLINYYEGKLLNKFDPISFRKVYYTYCSQNLTLRSGNIRVTLSSDDFGISGENMIGYGRVEEIEYDNSLNSNGKKVYYYFNTENQTRKGMPTNINLKNGLLTKEEFFDKNLTKLFEKEYGYTNLMPFTTYSGIKINRHIFGPSDYIDPGYNVPQAGQFPIFHHKFTYDLYPLNSERNKLTSTITKEFFNGNIVTNSESYTYNIEGNIKTKTNTNSTNEQFTTKYFYPIDYPNTLVNGALISNNLTGIVLRTEKYNGTDILSTVHTDYDAFNSLLLPKETYSSKGQNSPERRVVYDSYDTFGNVTQYTLENDTPVSIIWGYNKTKPIAKIENATNAQIVSALGTSNLSTISESNMNALNNLRVSLPNSMVTTYTYIPLVGVSTITDPNGNTITYQYDEFNRLEFVYDKNGNRLSENQYNYRIQN